MAAEPNFKDKKQLTRAVVQLQRPVFNVEEQLDRLHRQISVLAHDLADPVDVRFACFPGEQFPS